MNKSTQPDNGKLQFNFDVVNDDYVEMTNRYCEWLTNELGSNKKARAFLREQSWKTADEDTHELINNLIEKLRRMALNQ